MPIFIFSANLLVYAPVHSRKYILVTSILVDLYAKVALRTFVVRLKLINFRATELFYTPITNIDTNFWIFNVSSLYYTSTWLLNHYHPTINLYIDTLIFESYG